MESGVMGGQNTLPIEMTSATVFPSVAFTLL